jgi:hypothetical protein
MLRNKEAFANYRTDRQHQNSETMDRLCFNQKVDCIFDFFGPIAASGRLGSPTSTTKPKNQQQNTHQQGNIPVELLLAKQCQQ